MKQSYAFSSILCSFLSIIFAAVYLAARGGFDTELKPVFETVGLTLLLLNAPDVIPASGWFRLFQSYGFRLFLLFLLLCAIGAASFFFNLHIATFLSVAGFTAFLCNVLVLARRTRIKAIKLFIWGLAVCYLAISVATVAWYYISNPLLFESIAALPEQNLSPDSLLFTSIVQMINTSGVPSTGLHGAPPINYHFGSHYLFWQLSKLLRVHPLLIYQMVYAVLCIPFFFKSFFVLLVQIRGFISSEVKWGGVKFLIVLLFGFVGIAKYSWGSVAYKSLVGLPTIFCSESYNLSLSFLFLLISFLVFLYEEYSAGRVNYVGLLIVAPLWGGIIGLTKISTGYLLITGLAYAFIRLRMYKDWAVSLTFILNILVFFLVFWVVTDKKASEGAIKPFFLFKEVVKLPLLFFVPVYFYWLIQVLIQTAILHKISSFGKLRNLVVSKKTFALEILVVTAVAGLIPGMVLSFSNLNVTFFTEVQQWLALLFFLAYLPEFTNSLSGVAPAYTKKVMFGLLILCVLAYFDHLVEKYVPISAFLMYIPVLFLCFYTHFKSVVERKHWVYLASVFILLPFLDDMNHNWKLNLSRAFCWNYNIRAALVNQVGSTKKIKYLDAEGSLLNSLDSRNGLVSDVKTLFQNITCLYTSKEHKQNKVLKFLYDVKSLNDKGNLDKSNSVIYIQDYGEFVKDFRCLQAPFIVPALAGIPLLYGVPPSDMCKLSGYTFEYFPPHPNGSSNGVKNFLRESMKLGFEHNIIVNYRKFSLKHLRSINRPQD